MKFMYRSIVSAAFAIAVASASPGVALGDWQCSAGNFTCPDQYTSCCPNIQCGCCAPDQNQCDSNGCCTSGAPPPGEVCPGFECGKTGCCNEQNPVCCGDGTCAPSKGQCDNAPGKGCDIGAAEADGALSTTWFTVPIAMIGLAALRVRRRRVRAAREKAAR